MTEYFKNWVRRMNRSYVDETEVVNKYHVHQENNRITCVNIYTGQKGVAKCNKKDTFSFTVGRAIAYARCIGKPVPDMDYIPAKVRKNTQYEILTYNKLKCKITTNATTTYKNLVRHYNVNISQELLDKRLHETEITRTDFEIPAYILQNTSEFITIISKAK